MLDEMRSDNALRRVELERSGAQFDEYKMEWRAQVEADRAQVEANRMEWRARADADRMEWRARADAERAEQKRRFDAIDAAMENDKRVTREILLELREGRAMLRDMRHGIQANTEGLLRVLDELRRDDGPAAASA
jgi:hypothetical protein